MKGFELHAQLARDCFVVKDLELCRLLLMNDSNYPWCILVPRRDSLREIHQLSEADQIQLIQESSRLSLAMLKLFPGEKMNVAALGNIVPQLHVHHILRSTDDKAWPKPVWGQVPAQIYEKEAARRVCEQLASLV